MRCLDLKFYVPAKDYVLSQAFYSDLGFSKNWEAGDVSEFQIEDFRFLLQNFYIKEHAENFMIHMAVDDASLWYRKIKEVIKGKQYSNVQLKAPEMQPWGLVTAFLTDPTGVLWHISESAASIIK